MIRIYLDWGVVSYLKKDEYAELKDLFLSNKDRLFFVYSPAHLEDLMKSKDEPQFDDDIKLLSDLVDDHLLDIDKGMVLPYRVTLEEQLQKQPLLQKKFQQNKLKPLSKKFLKKLKKHLLKKFLLKKNNLLQLKNQLLLQFLLKY